MCCIFDTSVGLTTNRLLANKNRAACPKCPNAKWEQNLLNGMADAEHRGCGNGYLQADGVTRSSRLFPLLKI
jgi:hypothetical protein